MTYKKGAVAYVALFVTAVLGVVLLANLVFPTVKNYTGTWTNTEYYNRTNSSLNQTATLTYDSLVTLTVTGQTGFVLPAANYTRNDAAKTLMFEQDNAPVSYYTIAYTYEPSGLYLEPGEKALLGVVLLAATLGVVWFLFGGFGLRD